MKLQERDVFVKFCLIFNLIITCNNEDAFIDKLQIEFGAYWYTY